jgi:hypothetical protein
MDPGSSVGKKIIEKEVPAQALPKEPKLSVSQASQPADLTLMPTSEPGGFSKIVAVCVLLLAVGWFGSQPTVEDWIGFSYNSISEIVRGFLVPTSGPASPDTASTGGVDKQPAVPKSQGFTGEQGVRRLQLGGIDSSSTGGGHN